jgi:hypothetical protein
LHCQNLLDIDDTSRLLQSSFLPAIAPNKLKQLRQELRRREKLGIVTTDEDLGEEGNSIGSVDLPADMVDRLRVDLSIWKKSV